MANGAKLLAEWFWTDRWMGSSGFLLPMEARGVYREMLTQAWRRGARLPADHEAIQRAIGATKAEWRRAWPLVMGFWREDGRDLVNDTQLEVYAKAKAEADAASERGRRGARAKHERYLSSAQAEGAPQLEDNPPDPTPDPDLKSTAASRRPVQNREPDNGTFQLYCVIATEARQKSIDDDQTDSISNITAIFKGLCAQRHIAYSSERAARAVESVIVAAGKT